MSDDNHIEINELGAQTTPGKKLDIERQVGFDQSKKYKEENRISGRLSDGFKDAGMGKDFDIEGKAINPTREVIVVDRGKDDHLKDLNTKAQQIHSEASSETEAAFRIAQVVYQEMASLNADNIVYENFEKEDSPLKGQEVLLGNINQEKGLAGVCRHRSLLFQTLAAEVGLKVAVKRGHMVTSNSQYANHVWNELEADGKQLVVDLMNPPEGQNFDKVDYQTFSQKGGFTEVGQPQRLQYYDTESNLLYTKKTPESIISTTNQPQEISTQPDQTKRTERYQEKEIKDKKGITNLVLTDSLGKEVLKIQLPQEVANSKETFQVLYEAPDYNLRTKNNESEKLLERKFLLTGNALYLVELDSEKKTPARITRQLGIHENAGLTPDIPIGKNIEEFKEFIRNAIAFMESDPKSINFDIIASWSSTISGYEGVPLVEKIKIQKELEIRLYLTKAVDYFLQSQNYKEFGDYITDFDSELFNFLRDEILGVEGLEIVKKMEESNGAHWRKKSEEIKEDYKKYIEDMKKISGENNRNLSEEEAQVKLDVINRLFKATGMASYYTGPIRKDPITGNIILLEDEYMRRSRKVDISTVDENDRSTWVLLPGESAPKVSDLSREDLENKRNLRYYPHLLIHRDENYWGEKEDYREIRVGNSDPSKRIEFATNGDPAVNMRRLLYFPEELDFMSRMGLATKTMSLHKAGEVYAVTLPQLSGVRTLSEFLGEIGSDDDMTRHGKDRTWAYVSIIRGAGEAASAIGDLMIEPIKGGESAGDLSKLDNTVGNIKGSLEKLKYLSSRSPNILSHAASRLLISTIGWVNGQSKDRWTNFPKVPQFGRKTINAVVKFFAATMLEGEVERTLKELGASDEAIRNRELLKSLFGLFGDLGKLFWKSLNIKS
ncbi:MAG: EDR1-related protein [Candidatus Daviesbacteria bacterium]